MRFVQINRDAELLGDELTIVDCNGKQFWQPCIAGLFSNKTMPNYRYNVIFQKCHWQWITDVSTYSTGTCVSISPCLTNL